MLMQEYSKAEEDLQEYWKQRSRVQWQVQDRNTTYFHVIATQRKRRNMITQIIAENGEVLNEDREIMRVFVCYYKQLYSEPNREGIGDTSEYIQDCVSQDIPVILNSAHTHLITTPSKEEIRENPFRMGPDKASGPDGITARFLQSNWDLLKRDLTKAIGIFQTTRTPTEWLSSQIILIPKIQQPTTP